MSAGARVLYISYDGLTDPLGQSQVLPYLAALAKRGHAITIISCEKPEARAARGWLIASQCSEAGIRWFPLRYRKWPPILSTLADIAAMRRLAFALHRTTHFDLVHCRSYLPGLIGLGMKRRMGIKFLFDMRGFWIDERFERGIWSDTNPAYRAIAAWLRRREYRMFQGADSVVSLTHAARDELGRRGSDNWASKTSVIPCCADLSQFNSRGGAARLEGRELLGIDESAPVALFVGSLGGAYPLEPVGRFFRRWSGDRRDARLLMITRHPEAEVRAHPALAGLGRQLIVRAGERAAMPALIAVADVGLSFILPSNCALASSPTKVGEMLAMGIPIVANSGVGDIEQVMGEPGAGLLIPDLSDPNVDAAANAMWEHKADPPAARAAAEVWFSLDQGVVTYDQLYLKLAARKGMISS